MGHRQAAVQTLATLAGRLDASSRMPLEEPCLAPHPRYASLHPEADAIEWVQCAVVETHQRLCAFSSVFQGH